MADGWFAIGGAIAGGAVSLVTSVFLERSRRAHAARSMAIALKGEVQSILDIVETRRYVSGLEKAIADLENGADINLTASVEQDYFLVYRNNVDKIGLIDSSIALDVARFYTYANAFIEDTKKEPTFVQRPEDIVEKTQLYRETLDVLQSAICFGKRVVAGISAEEEAWKGPSIRWKKKLRDTFCREAPASSPTRK